MNLYKIPRPVINIIVLFFPLMVHNDGAIAQRIVNHDYPRIATLSWYGGNPAWLSKFDLVLGVDRDSTLYESVKGVNPDSYILTTTDWNAGGPFRVWGDIEAIPAQWRLRRSNGSYILYQGREYFADPTDYCGLYNGERYNQALPRVLMERTDWDAFDGVSSDGTWPFPYTSSDDIDLDRNGINDYTEHGIDWITSRWQSGQNRMRSDLRARFKSKWGNANEKMIFYWTMTDTMCVRVSNGGGWENMYVNSPKVFSSWVSLISQWSTLSVSPRINLISADIVYDSANAPNRKKDYYRFVRWGLTTALLHDAYYMSGDITDHHWTNYYDEYDVKLGYPKGSAQKLSNGCWVRFFDNGVSVVNPTNSTQTVTSGDLAVLGGYDGPYYRFQGNQDPVWNNGSLFTSVTLASTRASTPGSSQYVGDGIILVKTQSRVIADIIVDNAYSGTSPGSAPAAMTGFTWDRPAETNSTNPIWFTSTQTSQDNPDYYDSYYALAGSGSATAVFKPAINVTGRYNVYEWHGWRGKYPTTYREASNAPCAISHADGITNMTINQEINYGKWNLLGTFTFTANGNGSATLSNNANGYVIADAFRFEYAGEVDVPPSAPKQVSPQNGSVDQPVNLNFLWKKTEGALRYHLQIAGDSDFQTLFLNDSLITDTSRYVELLLHGTTYYWRVRAFNYYGAGPGSAVWSYKTKSDLYIRGRILYDQNNNGIRVPEDPSDRGVPGWKVYLQGPVIDSALTDKNGGYIFDRLPDGEYLISEKKLPGWERSFPSYPKYSVALGYSKPSAVCNFGYNAPYVAECVMDDGWNLISLPAEVISSAKNDIFPSSESNAFAFDGSFINIDNLEFGYGYWIKFPESQIIWIPGARVTTDTINLKKGWNLIGSVSDPFPVISLRTIPAGIVSSGVIGYFGSHTFVDTMKAGKGYWVSAIGAGKLILSRSGSPLPKNQFDFSFLDDLNSVTFGAGADSQKLFFTGNVLQVDLASRTKLPPAVGDNFDARFLNETDNGSAGMTIASAYPDIPGARILVGSVVSPLTVRWQIKESGKSFELRTESGNRYLLNGNGSVILKDIPPGGAYDKEVFTLRSLQHNQSEIPVRFDISQNYPNPLNNTTSVSLNLPTASRIKIDIYNLLGEHVAAWIDRNMGPGYHNLYFDASGLSSGVYFYKVVSDILPDRSLSLVKRMIVVK